LGLIKGADDLSVEVISSVAYVALAATLRSDTKGADNFVAQALELCQHPNEEYIILD
jgi:hypothetical protein